MTRWLLHLQYAAVGLCGVIIGLLPYFPTPATWELVLDLIEEERARIRAELGERQP